VALGAVAALAWTYLLGISTMAEAGDGHAAMTAMAPRIAAWSILDAVAMLLMWTVMMIGMMIPSAAPMILIYARVGRQAQSQGSPFAASGWFASGYLLVWAGFALVATALQWALEQSMLLTPMMTAASKAVAGLLLIVAGLYQWLPIKDSCLSQCQSPFQFIQRNGGFRGTPRGALALGMRHGAYCVGCCWALMLLLFFGGVMNLLWIAAIAALVLIEKVSIWGRSVSRISGGTMIFAGTFLIASIF
jgi:predicted metal-binding membrane protein